MPIIDNPILWQGEGGRCKGWKEHEIQCLYVYLRRRSVGELRFHAGAWERVEFTTHRLRHAELPSAT